MGMQKQQAIELLGGSVVSAAKEVGITYQAISKWPDVLTSALRDRVQAAIYRQLIELAKSDPEQALAQLKAATAGQGA